MQRMSQVLCGAAIMLVTATAIPLSTLVPCLLIRCKGKLQSRRMRIDEPVMIGLSRRPGMIRRWCILPSEAE